MPVGTVLKELRRKLGTLPLLRQAMVTYGTRSWVMDLWRSVEVEGILMDFIHVTRSEHCEGYW